MLKKAFAFILIFVVLFCFSVPAFAAYGLDNFPEPTCSYPYILYVNNDNEATALFTSDPLVVGGDYSDVKLFHYDGSSWTDVSDYYTLDDETMAFFALAAQAYPERVYHNYDIYSLDGELLVPASSPSSDSQLDFLYVLDVLKEQISVKNVVLALGVGVIVPVTLAFMWWGVRKLSSVLIIAFKKGKIKI